MKRRVLFVCIGNSCRSQMAEWFARTYGSDVIEAASAGMAPAMIVAEMTKSTMLDKNIKLVDPIPRGIIEFDPKDFDLVVNISGSGLPAIWRSKEILVWKVDDPIGQKQSVYERVRDELESLVMQLILRLRKNNPSLPTGPIKR